MEQVSGIGGLFFKPRDPASLAQWYHDHLGINLVPSIYSELPWLQEAGPCAFALFPETTTYFGDGGRQWMVNCRVPNLDAMFGAVA
jgi:glyoxylase I family protein